MDTGTIYVITIFAVALMILAWALKKVSKESKEKQEGKDAKQQEMQVIYNRCLESLKVCYDENELLIIITDFLAEANKMKVFPKQKVDIMVAYVDGKLSTIKHFSI